MLGWATVGMSLFYFAYRYNIMFVTDTQIDTRGLIYPRAIKQLFTGIYLAEVCMIGLFGASVAPGPLVLMVALLVFTVLFQISLKSALDPLLYNLPLSLLSQEQLVSQHSEFSKNGTEDAEKAVPASSKEAAAAARKGNIIARFFKPWLYSDYETLRALVPTTAHYAYTDEVESDAYYPPTVTSATPLLWIPRDQAGISKQEVAHTSKTIPITDEACELDEKGNLIWDKESTRPPVWEEKVLY